MLPVVDLLSINATPVFPESVAPYTEANLRDPHFFLHLAVHSKQNSEPQTKLGHLLSGAVQPWHQDLPGQQLGQTFQTSFFFFLLVPGNTMQSNTSTRGFSARSKEANAFQLVSGPQLQHTAKRAGIV